jgi:septum formation protein
MFFAVLNNPAHKNIVQSFSVTTFQAIRLRQPRHRTAAFPFRAMMSNNNKGDDSDATVSCIKEVPPVFGLEDDDGDVSQQQVEQPLILSLRHELLQWIDNNMPQQPDINHDVDDDNVNNNNNNNKNPTAGSIRLILASASPRRREILDMMGLQGRYQVIPSPLNESALQQELMSGKGEGNSKKRCHPMDYARILAEEKARALANDDALINVLQQPPSSSSSSPSCVLVLASDTIVDLDGTILEKPKDATDAHDMLSRLSGAEHSVHTGVAIYQVVVMTNNDNNDRSTTTASPMLVVEHVTSFTDTARVRFATLGRAEIQAYIETNEPMDKAGAYGIQGMGGQFVAHVEGDFFTVMGLPMHRTSHALARAVLLLLSPSSSSSLQTTTTTLV